MQGVRRWASGDVLQRRHRQLHLRGLPHRQGQLRRLRSHLRRGRDLPERNLLRKPSVRIHLLRHGTERLPAQPKLRPNLQRLWLSRRLYLRIAECRGSQALRSQPHHLLSGSADMHQHRGVSSGSGVSGSLLRSQLNARPSLLPALQHGVATNAGRRAVAGLSTSDRSVRMTSLPTPPGSDRARRAKAGIEPARVTAQPPTCQHRRHRWRRHPPLPGDLRPGDRASHQPAAHPARRHAE